MISGMIIIGYPCIGKTSTADISNGVIDLESSYFNNGNPKWYESYVNVAQDLASQGYTVLVSSHSNVVQSLKMSGHHDIPVVVFCPALEFKEDWIERAKIRFENSKLSKDERAYKRIKEHFEEDINALVNSGFEIHYLDNNSYLDNSIIYERYRLGVRFPNE
jgi:hypothetical protein